MAQVNIHICISTVLILAINLSKSQLSYDGPLPSTSNYFQQELINSSIDMSSLPELSCESYYTDTTTNDSPVKYYKLNVTSDMKTSYTSALSISTCCELDTCAYTNVTKKEQCNNEELSYVFGSGNATKDSYCSSSSDTALDTVLYILHEKKGKINIITEQDDSSCSNTQQSYIDLSDFPEGEYIVAVGGYGTESGNFFLHLDSTLEPSYDPTISPSNEPSYSPTSAPTKPPKINEKRMRGLVYGSVGGSVFLLLSYYLYKLYQYNKKGRQKKSAGDVSHKHKAIANGDVAENMGGSTEMVISVNGGVTKKPSINHVKFQSNEDPDHGEELEELQEPKPEEKDDTKLQPRIIRPASRREGDAAAQIKDNVQKVLAHAIECCKAGEQFDIYQVLAIRYFHGPSNQPHGIGKPLARFKCDFEIIRLSPFIRKLFMALITALTQTWGTSVVVWKLMDAYFENGIDSVQKCDMTQERWDNVISLKVLALLLSLVVTFTVGILLKGVKHNGLYEIINTLELQHLKRVPHLAIFFVQLGQFVNYWVCLLSIFGSYFIIFSSNQGHREWKEAMPVEHGYVQPPEVDYSSVGLDMILNAVALFFLLELDDMLVSEGDYEVCERHLKSVLEEFNGDIHNDDENNNDGQEVKGCDLQCCNKCMIPSMYYVIGVFSVIVSICCYVGGFCAPFLIFFCW